ncbi:MAG TPA: J domain-containing protein, partial [Vicinamibacteria bacterium]|nr:J domain-containing protein [Vicinamibacteria bacterium]
MDADSSASEALPLLARIYRERRSGVLSLGPGDAPMRVLLRGGHVVGLGPVPPRPALRMAAPRPDDSARVRLERLLVEVGIRPSPKAPTSSPGPSARDLRERLVECLSDGSSAAAFVEDAEAPPDVAEAAGATEPLILEAVRALRDGEAVRAALGDLDQRLVATAALAEERTLTLTEGYLLSRIDGTSSVRQVLQLVPLDPDETERTLLGLLLTGRVEYGPALAPRAEHRPDAAALPPGDAPPPAAETATDAEGLPAHADGTFPLASLIEADVPSWETPASPPEEALDPETRERRREIREVFDSLPSKNHFEVLGVEPGCTDADVKRAYATLVKRFHPDAHRDPRLQDLYDILEAIFIRVGEAWEVLGD